LNTPEQAITSPAGGTKKIEEAVRRYSYTQWEVADHLGMHLTSVNKVMPQRKGMLRK
jgi:hypothetical protein